MADEVTTPTATPAPAPEPPKTRWWNKLFEPNMLVAIATLITAVGGVVGAYINKTLKSMEKK